MSEKVKLSKDGSSIDFVQSDNIPTSLKKFRQSPEIEGFYRFIYENDLQKEAFEVLDRIINERRLKRQEAKAQAKAAAREAKSAEKEAARLATQKVKEQIRTVPTNVKSVVPKAPAAKAVAKQTKAKPKSKVAGLPARSKQALKKQKNLTKSGPKKKVQAKKKK